MFLTFLMSYWGRRIAICVVAAIALFGIVHSIQHTAYERGVHEGGQAAWVAAENNLRMRLADQNVEIAKAKAEAEDKVSIAKVVRVEQTKQVVAVRAKIAETVKSFDDKHAEIAPEVVAALPETPAVVQEDLSAYKDEVVSLKLNIAALNSLIDHEEEASRAEAAASEAQLRASAAELNSVTEERDFYKSAYGTGAKKPHGFWHKIKRVVTLGIAK